MRAIDADTGIATDLPGVGLLKPGQTRGTIYTVRASPDAVTGAKLSGQARVFLDQAAPVQTNVVSATLDAVPPTTSLSIQPNSGNTFLLTWSAADDALGSGVREYTLYVTLDGHNYTPIALHDTDTSFTYTGSSGSQPQFLVLAADNAGNLESAPDGVSIGLYPPKLNLGSVPLSVPSDLETLPQAPPPALLPVNPLLVAAMAAIPARCHLGSCYRRLEA